MGGRSTEQQPNALSSFFEAMKNDFKKRQADRLIEEERNARAKATVDQGVKYLESKTLFLGETFKGVKGTKGYYNPLFDFLKKRDGYFSFKEGGESTITFTDVNGRKNELTVTVTRDASLFSDAKTGKPIDENTVFILDPRIPNISQVPEVDRYLTNFNFEAVVVTHLIKLKHSDNPVEVYESTFTSLGKNTGITPVLLSTQEHDVYFESFYKFGLHASAAEEAMRLCNFYQKGHKVFFSSKQFEICEYAIAARKKNGKRISKEETYVSYFFESDSLVVLSNFDLGHTSTKRASTAVPQIAQWLTSVKR